MSIIVSVEKIRNFIVSVQLPKPVVASVRRDRVELQERPISSSWQASNQVYVSAMRLMWTVNTSIAPHIDIQIAKLNQPDLAVISPMPAEVTINDDDCVARLTEIDVAMSGASCTEAISALRDFIYHLYTKARAGEKAGPAMESTFRYLESHITDGPQQYFAERS